MKKIIFFLLAFVPAIIFAQEKASECQNEADCEESKPKVETKADEPTAKATPQPAKTNVCIEGNCENGSGTMNYKTGTYKGDWKDGLRHGKGTYTWINGDKYVGQWNEDKRHGMGSYTWKDGSKYKGNYSHGIRSGYGIYYYTNGSIYEGTWQNNLKHGIANFYYKESVNIGGRYFNNEYVSGTGLNQAAYKFKPE